MDIKKYSHIGKALALPILLLTVLSLSVQAKIKLPAVINSNMVLQQNAKVRLWGEATPKSTIMFTTSWNGEKQTAKCDETGRWKAEIATPSASFEAQSITVSEQKSKDEVVLSNLLIGEVWLASGQSNMEMPLKGFPGCCVKDGAKDAMNAHTESPYVRMFNVKKAQTFRPEEECEGSWLVPDFQNALEYSATAYYFASALSNSLQVPVGIVNCSYGGTHVESWTSADICRAYTDIPQDSVSVFNFGSWDFDRPIVCYNAMFHPVRHFTYRGIIWYQGCSNLGHHDVYAQRLANMVNLWRKEIGLGDIPFYQVQVAPYIFGKDENDTIGALLREAQYNAQYLIPNSDIVCINDLVEPIERYNIHPANKRPVGMRLAFLALNRDYGMKDLPSSGPRYDKEKFHVVADTAKVGFTINNGMGICRNWGLEGFEIAGSDRVFYPAKAEFHWQTNEVFLTSPSVPQPVAVRYCFRDFQIGNLIGGNELPLFPFRTDNW